jgi:mRNA-degrading endonuclease HigB of HigAB toxin-antitoxin module
VTLKFKQEGLESLGAIVRKGNFMTKRDIKHGFHHIKMIEEASLYLKFKYRGKTYRYLAMLMGSSSSPYIFHMMVKPALKYIRKVLKIRIM